MSWLTKHVYITMRAGLHIWHAIARGTAGSHVLSLIWPLTIIKAEDNQVTMQPGECNYYYTCETWEGREFRHGLWYMI